MSIARLLLSACVVSIVSAAASSSAWAGQQIAAGDFNGDGKADLAIGVPSEDIGTTTDAGVVHVLYGRGIGLSATNDELWHQNKPDILEDAEFNDQFGRALAAGDFNGDGFDDLAIATNEDGNGSIHVIFGRSNGLNALNNTVFTQQNSTGSSLGPHLFGACLAVGDFDGDEFDDLAIGEPSDTVFGLTNVGSVTVLYGSAQVLGSNLQFWQQHSEGVADIPESGDAFGASLAAGDFDGDGRDDLAIGVPTEDIGQIIDVGVVHVLYGTATGLTGFGSDFWHQNSEDVSDSLESGDTFGASLASGDFDNNGRDDLVIGVPFEKISAEIHAGAVHVLYGRGGGVSATDDDFWHQNRGGILDECETDDVFGETLISGDFDGDGFDDLAVAVPEEDLEAEKDGESADGAGAIAVLYGRGGGLSTNFNQFWHFNLPHMDGDPADARWGTALAVGDFDNDGFDDLAGSSPTEKLDAVNNAGAVHLLYGSSLRLIANHGAKYWHQNVPGIADECETNDAMGGNSP